MSINLNDLPPKMRRQAEAKIKAQSEKKHSFEDLPEKSRKNDMRGTSTPQQGTKRQSKYGNHEAIVNGIRFDSKKEATRYEELMLLYRAGIITDLRLQQHFTLKEGFKMPDGTPVRKMEYIADFVYFDGAGEYVIEDVKSEATRKNPVYRLKKKLMADLGHMITEV